MNSLLLTLALSFATTGLIASAQAEENTPFKKQIYVIGVGQVRLSLVDFGEPVSNPYRFKIDVKCDKTKSWKPVEEYYVCNFGSEKYDAANKTLEIKFLSGRVIDTGETYCDQTNDVKLSLASICKPEKK